MIRYSCDLCKRDLDPEDDLRYVVKMEVYAAFDPAAANEDEDDRDHLQEIQDMLERLEDADDDQIGDDVYQQLRFDLCPECRKKFLKNPLGPRSHRRQGGGLQQELSGRKAATLLLPARLRRSCRGPGGLLESLRRPFTIAGLRRLSGRTPALAETGAPS